MIEKTENKQNQAGPGWPIYKNTLYFKAFVTYIKGLLYHWSLVNKYFCFKYILNVL